jgi:hypothetical protein
MIQLRILMLMAFCLPLITGSANADLILDLKYSDGSTDQTKNIGDTIFLDLSITETAPDTIINDEGLFSAGGRILRSVGNAVFGAPVATDVDTNWDLFDDAPASSGTGVEIAKVLGTSFGVAPTFAFGPGFGVGTVKIAQFAVQITGGSGLSTLSADLLGSITGLQSFVNGTTFDAQVASFNSVNLTVNGAAAVPEPASMILASLTAAVAGGGSYLRRRKQRKSAE